MKILTQPGRLDQSQQHTYQIDEDNNLNQKYQGDGYQKRERIYQLTYQYHIYTIICPEYRKQTDIVLIIPEFLLPGRPYPIYVYLYAIEDYSKNPDKSQRHSAEATRKQFGLTTFAHTTLGRAIKRFVKQHMAETENNDAKEKGKGQAKECQQTKGYNQTEHSKDNRQAEGNPLEDESLAPDNNNTEAAPIPAQTRPFPSLQATKQMREQTAQLFENYSFPEKETSFLESCHILARKIFRKHQRILI